jgi:hypothetical protein
MASATPLPLLCKAKASPYWKSKGFKDWGTHSEWPQVVDAVIKVRFSIRLTPLTDQTVRGDHTW